MKNHDIHENKNVCPEFNGEKMHEHNNSALKKRANIVRPFLCFVVLEFSSRFFICRKFFGDIQIFSWFKHFDQKYDII